MKICNLKINVSCEASVKFQRISQNATPATEFAPCHHFTQPWQWDSHKTMMVSKCLQSVAPATKNAAHLLKTSQEYCACHTKRFCHVMKHVWMSQSATPATRNEATRRLKPSKVTPFAEIAIGTAIRPSHERLRTVAQRRANTPSTPRTPEWNGNPCYTYSGKIHCHWIHQPEQLGHLGLISHHDHSLVGKLIQSIHMISQYATIFVCKITFMVKYPHLLQKKAPFSWLNHHCSRNCWIKSPFFVKLNNVLVNHHCLLPKSPCSSQVQRSLGASPQWSHNPPHHGPLLDPQPLRTPSNIGATEDTWWNRAK